MRESEEERPRLRIKKRALSRSKVGFETPLREALVLQLYVMTDLRLCQFHA